MGSLVLKARRWARPIVVALCLPVLGAQAADYRFAVHPVLSKQETRELYGPLLRYLEAETGSTFTLVSSSNFLVHWQLMRRENYDFVLDGPHFTDYRAQRMGYTALAKLPGVVSYTLVANENAFVLEPAELIGKKIASTPSPALGALRLAQLYPNSVRQPVIIEADDSVTAAELAESGIVAAAIIPAPLVGRFTGLTTVATTAQVPSPAISVSPNVPEVIREKVRQALMEASEKERGRQALARLNIDAFESADNKVFAGQADLLKGIWGY